MSKDKRFTGGGCLHTEAAAPYPSFCTSTAMLVPFARRVYCRFSRFSLVSRARRMSYGTLHTFRQHRHQNGSHSCELRLRMPTSFLHLNCGCSCCTRAWRRTCLWWTTGATATGASVHPTNRSFSLTRPRAAKATPAKARCSRLPLWMAGGACGYWRVKHSCAHTQPGCAGCG
jgi:hypothetical protein